MLNICLFKKELDINCLHVYAPTQQEHKLDQFALKQVCLQSEQEEKQYQKKI